MTTNRQNSQAAIDALTAKQGVADSVTPTNLSSDQLQVMLDNALMIDESYDVVVVNAESDFPAPVTGVITLANDTVYVVQKSVTMTNRIVFGTNSTLTGLVSTTSQLVYVGADTFLTAANNRLYVRNLAIITTNAASTLVSKTGTEFMTFRGFFFQCAGAFGTFESDANDCIFDQGFGIFNGSGFKVGNLSTTAYCTFRDCRFIQNTASPIVDITGASLDEIVIADNQFIPVGNGACIAADAGNININRSAGVRNNDFQMANGQVWLSGGVTVADINWFFSNNKGIEVEPSIILGSALLSGNTTTTNTVAATPTAIAGTFVNSPEDQRMNSISGVITNTAGSILQATMLAQGTVDNAGGGTETFTFEFFINGVVVPNITASVNVDGNDQNTWVMVAHAKLPLSAQVNVRVTNANGTDCIVPDMQFTIQAGG